MSRKTKALEARRLNMISAQSMSDEQAAAALSSPRHGARRGVQCDGYLLNLRAALPREQPRIVPRLRPLLRHSFLYSFSNFIKFHDCTSNCLIDLFYNAALRNVKNAVCRIKLSNSLHPFPEQKCAEIRNGINIILEADVAAGQLYSAANIRIPIA